MSEQGAAGAADAAGVTGAVVEDSVDRHIARWRGKAPFDVPTEEVITRIQLLTRHIKQVKDRALAETGLQVFEFETLHRLASRGRPWRATPSELAAELLLSPAGMTGRLATLEEAGLVRRLRAAADRRRVDVELTEEGHARWTAAMRLRGEAETAMLEPFEPAERAALSALLKRMLLHVETPLTATGPPPGRISRPPAAAAPSGPAP